MPEQVRQPTVIADSQITIVFQGPWNDQLRENIARVRESLPGAPIVVGSSDARMREVFSPTDAVTLALAPDPGALPACMRGTHAPLNNVNRQIVSSQVGLALAATPYAVKIRTDCTLDSRAFVELYQRVAACGTDNAPLLANSVYTLHPDGIEGFSFHVSDWFFFGPSETLRTYYDVPLMTQQDATWFDEGLTGTPHRHYFARQYRGRFSPEQYLAIQNARKEGYVVPRFLDDVRAVVVESYRAYLGSRFIVCDVSQFGLVFEKYRHASQSHYQFFNCVWGSDWRAMAEVSRGALPGVSLGRVGPTLAHRKKAVAVIRSMDRILGALKRCGLMPIAGDFLGAFRRFDFRRKNVC